MITAVLTSCNRYDLLDRTLESFFRSNTAFLEDFIIVEDGPDIPDEVREKHQGRNITWISTGRRVGQIAAIDYAYSRIKTPYVFHLEDDWEFYRSQFIERSLLLLEAHPKCLQVYIRPMDALLRHPVLPHKYVTEGVEWQRMAYDFVCYGEWHGFSFNPGLRRFSDYVAIGGYGAHTRFDPKEPLLSESAISKVYRRQDYYAAILADGNGKGYVRHIGKGRHVGAEQDQ